VNEPLSAIARMISSCRRSMRLTASLAREHKRVSQWAHVKTAESQRRYVEADRWLPPEEIVEN
jgi:hypothetical protein